MSTEKTGEVVAETNHGISTSADVHYPVVAEGVGKTLDEAAGAKAKEVHNVSFLPPLAKTSRLVEACLSGR